MVGTDNTASILGTRKHQLTTMSAFFGVMEDDIKVCMNTRSYWLSTKIPQPVTSNSKWHFHDDRSNKVRKEGVDSTFFWHFLLT